jgi:hypothetical protein
MIGTNGALVILIVNLLATGILGVVGVVTGLITSVVLRQRWRLKDGFTDAIVSGLTALVSASMLSIIDGVRGTLQSRVLLVILIAMATVVLTHVVQFRQSAR